MSIPIRQYDDRERQATSRLSYPAIRAFRPAAFIQANFPARISDERELIRYCDIMNELDSEQLFFREKLYSRAEAALMASISAEIEALTDKLFSRPTQPFMCLFAPISMLRAVVALCQNTPNATVMEIGPGSGLLGAYLIQASRQFGDLNLRLRYRSTDNAQALYLWQNRLFGHLGGNGFADYALVEQMPISVEEPVASIPWWHFAENFKRPWKVDLVVCDAAMGEMEAFAANYIVRLAAEMLKESPIGAFIFRHIGEQRINSMAYVESRFAAAGFKKYEADGVVVHSLRPITLPARFLPVGGDEKMRTASEFLKIDRAKLLDSYSFFDFVRLTEPAPAPTEPASASTEQSTAGTSHDGQSSPVMTLVRRVQQKMSTTFERG
jgi:hypothetical protein